MENYAFKSVAFGGFDKQDQAGTELNELAALLDRSTKKEEKEPRG